jgi:hypothetical protein
VFLRKSGERIGGSPVRMPGRRLRAPAFGQKRKNQEGCAFSDKFLFTNRAGTIKLKASSHNSRLVSCAPLRRPLRTAGPLEMEKAQSHAAPGARYLRIIQSCYW